jgi:O-antigen ligase
VITSLGNSKFTKHEVIGLLIFISMFVIIEIYITSAFPNFFLPFNIFIYLIGIVLILNRSYIKDTPTVIFILFLIPLVYLNNLYHYDFRYELISSIPLIILFILAIINYIGFDENWRIRKLYIQTPLLLMVLYFITGGIISILQGKNLFEVSYQMFQFSLYLIIFPLLYLLHKRRNYLIIFYSLLFVAVISSIEYIMFNVIIYGERFVTFQSGFLPVVTAIVFSYYLYQKKSVKKFFALLLLFIIVTGTLVTLTRTLWIVTFIVIILVYFFYLIANNKMTFRKVLVFVLIVSIPVIFMRDTGKNIRKDNKEFQSVEYRSKSIANPLEDASLLMRVELGYYAFNKFLDKPIFGNGLGDYIKFKILGETKTRQYYLDNTWFYLLWKGGIIGFLLFLWLYIRFLKVAYSNFISSPEVITKVLNLGLFAGIIGLMFLGILSPLLVKYKTNALLAFLFAYVEYEHRKLSK